MVSNDPTNQSVTSDAFEILHTIVDRRLKNRRLTVIDATSLQVEARKSLVNLARNHDCPITAVVFDLPHALIYTRNQAREDRNIPNRVVRNQIENLRKGTRQLHKEGFHRTFFIKNQEEADSVVITRTPLRSNQTQDSGPFDIIGDVHGCHQELHTLLQKLGYTISHDENGANATHPDGRKAVFVGDLVDRGPGVDQVLELVMNMTKSGKRPLRPRQPRRQTHPYPEGQPHHNEPRAGPDDGTAHSPRRRVQATSRHLPQTAARPHHAGPRPSGSCPRRDPQGIPRPALTPHRAVLHVRRDLRRNRRVGPAGPSSTGHRTTAETPQSSTGTPQ